MTRQRGGIRGNAMAWDEGMAMGKRKVTILGAGHVGSHVALSLALEDVVDEVVLVDKDQDKASAQALDVSDAMSLVDHEVCARSGDYADVQDSDVVVCAIGQPRKPGQTRLDMLDDSVAMCDELLASLEPYEMPGILVSITNPCDVIVDYLRKGLGLPADRAFGTGTLLDTARLHRVVADMCHVARSAVQAVALGEHGDSSMVPYSLIHVGARSYGELGLSDEEVLRQMRAGGYTVIEGKKSTEFGIGRAAARMVEAILRDERKVMPASVALSGQYGESDVQIGVPCIIGGNGIEEVLNLSLEPSEEAAFHHSCEVVRDHIARAAARSSRGVR